MRAAVSHMFPCFFRIPPPSIRSLLTKEESKRDLDGGRRWGHRSVTGVCNGAGGRLHCEYGEWERA